MNINSNKTYEIFSLTQFVRKRCRTSKYDGYGWKILEHLTYITLLLILILTIYSNICYTTQHSKYENTNFAEDVKYNLMNKSKLDTTKFTNTKLNARNALEIPIIHSAIDELINYYKTYIQPNLNKENHIGPIAGPEGHNYFCVSHPSLNSDMQWISVNNLASYNHFLPYFEEMRLNDIFKKIIDVDSKITVYSMFLLFDQRYQSTTGTLISNLERLSTHLLF